ncbi:(2Fe-2S)-binding protein [Acidobacteriota bacterium]
MEKQIEFTLNDDKVKLSVDPERMLLWILRSDLDLTGAKHSCGEGFCGACTVLVNDNAVLSCQYPVKNAAGKTILTIEGLQKNGILHPIQAAFLQHNALQCGFCTPGMILSAYSFLKKNPHPTEPEIREAMEGNLCRCGSYDRIIKAIHTASQAKKGTRS